MVKIILNLLTDNFKVKKVADPSGTSTKKVAKTQELTIAMIF